LCASVAPTGPAVYCALVFRAINRRNVDSRSRPAGPDAASSATADL
jgi:hypothetical protein